MLRVGSLVVLESLNAIEVKDISTGKIIVFADVNDAVDHVLNYGA